jgi:hypothetical protein
MLDVVKVGKDLLGEIFAVVFARSYAGKNATGSIENQTHQGYLDALFLITGLID